MTAFLVTYGFSTFFLSGIGDKFHPVKVLQIMIVCWFVLMLLMGFCHNYRLMVLLRILLGIAEGPLIYLFAILGAGLGALISFGIVYGISSTELSEPE